MLKVTKGQDHTGHTCALSFSSSIAWRAWSWSAWVSSFSLSWLLNTWFSSSILLAACSVSSRTNDSLQTRKSKGKKGMEMRERWRHEEKLLNCEHDTNKRIDRSCGQWTEETMDVGENWEMWEKNGQVLKRGNNRERQRRGRRREDQRKGQRERRAERRECIMVTSLSWLTCSFFDCAYVLHLPCSLLKFRVPLFCTLVTPSLLQPWCGVV